MRWMNSESAIKIASARLAIISGVEVLFCRTTVNHHHVTGIAAIKRIRSTPARTQRGLST